jgi:ubiquitin carboxyl-terminal hydrolase L3
MISDYFPAEAITPQERGKLLEKSDIFAAIHLDAANQGQTAAPPAEADVNLHFTCFVPSRDPAQEGALRLIELDGNRGGPIDCGSCTDFLTVSF